MKLYIITTEVDGIDTVARWSGYNEQTAIAQAFLYYAQNGARSLKVIEIDDRKLINKRLKIKNYQD